MNFKKAESALKVLTKQQIEEIIKSSEEGGIESGK
jgi:hypothetical protein